MDYELIIKFLLLASACLSFNYGFTAPNPHTPKGVSVVYRGQHFETMVLIWVFFGRLNVFALTLSHVATSLALQFPGAKTSPVILNAICPYPSSNLGSLQSLSIYFIVGALGMVLGGLLRAWCYVTLGRLFTYMVTLSPEHKLITSGPYAYVRHPAYTGVVIMLSSGVFTHLFSPGNYIVECGIMRLTLWKWIIGYWLLVCAISLVSLRRRGKVEDELMKKTFGQEWATYRKAVPYSFVPYIL